MQDYFIIIYEGRQETPVIKLIENYVNADSTFKRIEVLLNNNELFTVYKADILIDKS